MPKGKDTPRRDKWGRFAPKRRNVKLKPYVKPERTTKGRFKAKRVAGKPHHWRTIQSGEPIEVNTYGYFMVIRALVPGGWATDSTPSFIVEAPEESLHLVIWRTRVHENLYHLTESEEMDELKSVMLEGKELAKNEMAFGQGTGQDIIILSTELRVMAAPHESFQVDVWPGITPPKWLRNVK